MYKEVRIFTTLVLALSARVGNAQWIPEWIGTWQYDEPLRSVQPRNVRVADDGGTLAAILVTHHSTAHATLARFNADGSFAWTREHAVWTLAGIELVGGGRVAVVGESNVADAPVFVRVYDSVSGALIWQRESTSGHLFFIGRLDAHQLAVAANGELLVRASDGGDYVVIRYDAAGNPLPDWRWASGSESAAASDIVALADGGAIVSGEGDTHGGGYATVRFDAQGNPVFSDVELGDIGNPLGPARIAVDAGGDIVVAASPESKFGEPLAQVWKLSADGDRLWTRVLPNPNGNFSGLRLGGFALADNGDVLATINSTTNKHLRLLRLDGASGTVLHDVTAEVMATPTTMVLAPNGRVLIGGYQSLGGASGLSVGRIGEFDADGQPCRSSDSLAMSSDVAGAVSADGWSVLGVSEYVQGTDSDAVIRRYDANGPCDAADPIFADGFDATHP